MTQPEMGVMGLGSSSHRCCSGCGGGEFWIMTDGRIICADDECHQRFGQLEDA